MSGGHILTTKFSYIPFIYSSIWILKTIAFLLLQLMRWACFSTHAQNILNLIVHDCILVFMIPQAVCYSLLCNISNKISRFTDKITENNKSWKLQTCWLLLNLYVQRIDGTLNIQDEDEIAQASVLIIW